MTKTNKEKGTIMGKIFFRKSPFATPCGKKGCKENATTLLNIDGLKTYSCIAVCESCLKKYDVYRSKPFKEKPVKKPIMKTQGTHIKIICGVCEVVIKQCKCMDCNKTVSTGICDKHELTEEAKSNLIESMAELTQSGDFGGVIGDAEEMTTKKFKDITNGMEITDTVTITVEDFRDGIKEIEDEYKYRKLKGANSLNKVASIVNKNFLNSPYIGKDWEAVRLSLICELSDYLYE